MKLRNLLATTALVASTLSGTALVATPAVADSSKTCSVSDMSSKIKGQQPVILVHGLVGNGDAWTQGSDSMVNELKKLKGVYVDEPFDYSSTNTKWVTDDNIGPRLARRIDCLAKASGREPVVIGHSMGGLAARLAASQKVNGRTVGNEFGMLITLGTPNLGSGWANVGTDFIRSLCPARTVLDTSLCDFGQISALRGLRDNGPEIKNLPWMPTDVPVLALAGDVSIHAKIFQADVTMDTSSDLVVSKNSALQDIRTTSAGGGSQSYACTMEVGLQLPKCWHSALTSNRDVIQTTVDAVKRFTKATTPKPVDRFAGFVSDKWGRHLSQLKIKSGGTGNLMIDAGAGGTEGCGTGDGYCGFHGDFTSTVNSDGSLNATYTKIWYTFNGTQIVPMPPSWDTTMPKVGDSITIRKFKDLTLLVQQHGSLAQYDMDIEIDGKSYRGFVWCGPKSGTITGTTKVTTFCGA